MTDEPAFPTSLRDFQTGNPIGLTKRQFIAAIVLAGIAVNGPLADTQVAAAILAADELLRQTEDKP